MRSKEIVSVPDALKDLRDGATLLIGGFGLAGQPIQLIDGVLEHGARDLTIVSNNAGNGNTGIAALISARRVSKVICSFPRQHDSWAFDAAYRASRIELEVVPQGNLAERLRAAGAGIPAFYTPTGVGTLLAAGREHREFGGRTYILEQALHGDVALIGGFRGDPLGNIVYRKTSRNFNPVMATAARMTIAQVDRIVAVGDLDPESIVTPGIYVDRIVAVGSREWLDANS